MDRSTTLIRGIVPPLRFPRTAAAGLALLGLAAAAPLPGAQQARLTLGTVEGPGFSARGVDLAWAANGESRGELRIAELRAGGKVWTGVHIACPTLRLEGGRVECPEGRMLAPAAVGFSFAWSIPGGVLDASIRPTPEERWTLRATTGQGGWRADLDVDGARVERLAPLLPAGLPLPRSGKVSGTARVEGGEGGLAGATADLRLAGVAFSDEAGLRAGEGIGAALSLSVRPEGSGWAWGAGLDWHAGEVYWHPAYLTAGGHRAAAHGRFEGGRVILESARADLAGIGTVEAGGVLELGGAGWRELRIASGGLAVPPLYERILKGSLGQTVFADLADLAGTVSGEASLRDGVPQALRLRLEGLALRDRGGRFAVARLDADLPWSRTASGEARLAFGGGEVLRIPVGRFEVAALVQPARVLLPAFSIPVLDGGLRVIAFDAGWEDGLAWHFEGELGPLSLAPLTRALGIQEMHGSLRAVVPRVAWERSTLAVGGPLLFNVFDGEVRLENLVLTDPLGRAPRLAADLDMNRLDLELLTRTFSFGTILGRIDARVSGLQLSNWRPDRFDARVASSPGDYPKRISQRAVENISALGGAGAAAAIQRSVLRFFDTFGYEKIGWSCRLANGVCAMGGVSDAPQGYVIVKGGGIPAITVLGYNRAVDWNELVARLARITQAGAKPVVQ